MIFPPDPQSKTHRTPRGPPKLQSLFNILSTYTHTYIHFKFSIREKPGTTRPHFLGPCGAGTLASRAGGLRPLWVAFGHLGSPFHMSSPPRMLPVTTPLVPSPTPVDPPWSPHSPRTTPHDPLTRLGQPHLVPSLTPDNPPWSSHSLRTTPHGPLTHP